MDNLQAKIRERAVEEYVDVLGFINRRLKNTEKKISRNTLKRFKRLAWILNRPLPRHILDLEKNGRLETEKRAKERSNKSYYFSTRKPTSAGKWVAIKPTAYGEYLKSGAWEDIKKNYFNGKKKSCEVCNSTAKVSLHHKYYAERGQEKIEDLIALCDVCHKEVHAFIGPTQKNMRVKTDRYVRQRREEIYAKRQAMLENGPV